MFKDHLPKQTQKNFLLEVLEVLDLVYIYVFMSMIHFELIIVYSARCTSFFFLHGCTVVAIDGFEKI